MIDKTKYNRLRKDPSQLQLFGDEVIDNINEIESHPTELLSKITYAELKALRDSSQLVPGQFYRITDYTCTTTALNTQSAGHVFDIIVVALDKETLSEEASAIMHEGDTYFANNNLAAWKLWYCLDNDTTRFGWADSVNGKGIIYRMIDEFDNDCPYDFKNIQYQIRPGFEYFQWGSTYNFVRDESLDADGYYGWRCISTPSAWSNPYCFTNTLDISTDMTLYSDTSGSVISYGGTIQSVSISSYDAYTFSISGHNYIDGSLGNYNVFCNYIAAYRDNAFEYELNRIYICAQYTYNNIFDKDCHDITISSYAQDSIFKDSSNIKIELSSKSHIEHSSNIKSGGGLYGSLLKYVSSCVVENGTITNVSMTHVGSITATNISDSTLFNAVSISLTECFNLTIINSSAITSNANLSYVTINDASVINIVSNSSRTQSIINMTIDTGVNNIRILIPESLIDVSNVYIHSGVRASGSIAKEFEIHNGAGVLNIVAAGSRTEEV